MSIDKQWWKVNVLLEFVLYIIRCSGVLPSKPNPEVFVPEQTAWRGVPPGFVLWGLSSHLWFVTLLWVVMEGGTNELWGLGVVGVSIQSSVIVFCKKAAVCEVFLGLCVTVTRSGGVLMLQSGRQEQRCCCCLSETLFYMKTPRREGTVGLSDHHWAATQPTISLFHFTVHDNPCMIKQCTIRNTELLPSF